MILEYLEAASLVDDIPKGKHRAEYRYTEFL